MTNDNEKAQKWKLSKGLGLFLIIPSFSVFLSVKKEENV